MGLFDIFKKKNSNKETAVTEEKAQEALAPEVGQEAEAIEAEAEVKEEQVQEETIEPIETEPVEETEVIEADAKEEALETENEAQEETALEAKEEDAPAQADSNSSWMNRETMLQKSFLGKMMQASDDTKRYYNEIKNKVLSYKKIKSRTSWKHETFNVGRSIAMRLKIKGKTLCLYLSLDPNRFEHTKYYCEDVSNINSLIDTPCKYKVNGERKLKYALELIDIVLSEMQLVPLKIENKVDYVSYLEYKTDEELINLGYAKIVENKRKSVAVDEVEDEAEPVEEELAVEPVEEEPVEEEPVEEEVIEDENDEEDPEKASREFKPRRESTDPFEEYIDQPFKEEEERVVFNSEFEYSLRTSNQIIKDAYNKIRNTLDKTTLSRFTSDNYEEYRKGDKTLLRISLFDRKLRVYVNLKIEDINRRYVLKDYSEHNGYDQVITMYKVYSDYSARLASELIEKKLCTIHEVEMKEKVKEFNYSEFFKDYSKVKLRRAGYEGGFKQTATIDDIDMLTDEFALSSVILEKHLNEPSENVVEAEISIGELSAAFSSSYVIDLPLLKKIGLISSKANYLRITEGGKCSKALTIKADEYEMPALKQIILLKGNAYRMI